MHVQRAVCQLFGVYEIAVADLPCERVVLHHAEAGAFHHAVALRVGQQHAHERRLGQYLAHTALDGAVFGRLQHAASEARAVVVIHIEYAALHGRAALHGGVYREVAALGVAAHAQLLLKRQALAHRVQILHRRLLRRDGGEVGHVEVLLPADDGHVGAAERYEGGVVLQHEGDGGELLLPIYVEGVREKTHAYISEARAGSRREQQRVPVTGAVYHVVLGLRGDGGVRRAEHIAEQLRAVQLPERHSFGEQPHTGNCAAKVNIRQF